MERIQELEREHVQLYGELLKALDKLYQLQRGHGRIRDKDAESTLATRRQLQMSIEKSAAMIRTLERLLKYEGNPGMGLTTTEDLLAMRLGKLMQENYEMDYEVADIMKREDKVRQEFREERLQYSRLSTRLRELSDKINSQKETPDESDEIKSIPTPGRSEIINENERIEELLLALKIHGGYDPLM